MSRSRLLRAAAWLGACAIGVLGANAVAPVSAVALPKGTQLRLDHTALVPGSFGKTQSVYLYNYDADFTLNDVAVTIDTAKLAGVATAKLTFEGSSPCEQSGTRITCSFDTLSSENLFAGITTLTFRPEASAAVGDEGEVSVKVTSRDQTFTRTSKVTISEKVALEVGPIITKKVKPGDTFTNPLTVKNTGGNAINGVDLFFFYESMFTVPKRYDNCDYGTFAAYCHFEATLAPQQEYVLSEELPLQLRPQVPAPGVAGASFAWSTPIDGRDNFDMVQATKPTRGTQGTLRLVQKPSGLRAQGAQTEDSFFLDTQSVILTVEGTNRSDVSAVGGQVRAAVGTTITAKLGVKNLGPAYASGITEPAATVTVAPPAGTTVTTVPAGCTKADTGYVCRTNVHPLEVGEAVTWDFGLRVDAAGELTGTVTVTSSSPDATSDNDVAKLVVNPVGGAGAGGGGGSDDGPSLPITGQSGTVLGGAAAVLLAAGAALFVVTRRRRTRFVA
ncbi:LPXTG cell wall anchor domain-containing protein [Micromonospora sp. ZYX-F-536]|uniref:LPXTG cell wall anchor domain-containing protein n=1 Tax=Micromonospora sp. ZYX-F-536 TaxID=3457629 RepID=UPI00404098C2